MIKISSWESEAVVFVQSINSTSTLIDISGVERGAYIVSVISITESNIMTIIVKK